MSLWSGYNRGMRNKLTDELAVCGFNAVVALGRFHPDRINRLFLREDRLQDVSAACRNLAARKRPYKICDDEELERVCKSPRHQGLVAMILQPELQSVTEDDLESWSSSAETVLLLADVGNDNNLGAIARSAAFFGVKRIVLTASDGEARLSTAAYRVAEGGMEHVDLRVVRDPAGFLVAAAERMVVVGAEHRSRIRLDELSTLLSEAKTRRLGAASATRGLGASIGTLVVLGNEEYGLTKAVKEACTLLVRIPGTGLMESLNVAQAATLFMHELYTKPPTEAS